MQASTFVTSILSAVIVVMGFPVALKLAGRSPDFIRNLGFIEGQRPTTLSWLLAVIVAVGYISFTFVKVPGVAQHAFDISSVKFLAIVASVLAGIVEEGFFRRLLMDRLAKAGVAAWLQIAAAAVVFGIAHGLWGFLGGSIQAAIGAASATAMLGGMLGVVYLAGGRSLAPCIAGHCLIDAVVEPALLFAAVSGFH